MADPQEFLDLYRQLEQAARQLFPDSRQGTPVNQLLHHPHFAALRPNLEYCREVRNLLSHQPKIEDNFAVQPTQQMLDLLQNLVLQLKRHPRVAQIYVPVGRAITTTANAPAFALMQRMQKAGVSHAPILQNGVVTGVFSTDMLYHCILSQPGQPLPAGGLLQDFAPCIGPATPQRGFIFTPAKTQLYELETQLEGYHRSQRRIKLIFVTKTGDPQEKLAGLLTPWDVLGA